MKPPVFPGPATRASVWKVWDEFGIQGTEFLPYFLDKCPVKTDRAEVLATVYRRKGRTLVALGSWANEEVPVKLHIDWPALGLDPRATRYAPPIAGMQTERVWKSDELSNT